MNICRVIGNVVSTIKNEGYEAHKIMIVQPIDPEGNAKGKSFLAVDMANAGIGDTVITVEEGGSARQLIHQADNFTVKSVIAGIVDHIEH